MSELDKLSTDAVFRLNFLGGGIGAMTGSGGGAGGETAGGETDRELNLNEPVLLPLSFSVSSLSLSVLLLDGLRSGDDDAEDEDGLRPKPNFCNVFRRPFSIII
jgi:hypothetical protein